MCFHFSTPSSFSLLTLSMCVCVCICTCACWSTSDLRMCREKGGLGALQLAGFFCPPSSPLAALLCACPHYRPSPCPHPASAFTFSLAPVTCVMWHWLSLTRITRTCEKGKGGEGRGGVMGGVPCLLCRYSAISQAALVLSRISSSFFFFGLFLWFVCFCFCRFTETFSWPPPF